ncbi:MAG TPA: hypothetical protein VK780_11180 [Thermoanaerobaculia bacterium]|nr:hypothetical protein [Thermoanaerobaculia bacterium]
MSNPRKAVLGAALVLALTLGAASAASPSSPDKMQSLTGTVSKLQAADRTLVVAQADGSATQLVWTSDTKINGTLSQGAKVTVRYTTLSDGQNLAHQISVGR